MPPGRSARLWLRDRLAVASRATDVLEQKSHALVQERRRLQQQVEETREIWEQTIRQADAWFLKAMAIGGRQQIGLAASRLEREADARITWHSLMGVTYPARVEAVLPDPGAVSRVAETSALAFAASAYGEAVQQALDHAAATRALDLLEREIAMTRRRLRGLEDEWIPRLRDTLRQVELYLSEEEREDMVRSKWASEERHEERA